MATCIMPGCENRKESWRNPVCWDCTGKLIEHSIRIFLCDEGCWCIEVFVTIHPSIFMNHAHLFAKRLKWQVLPNNKAQKLFNSPNDICKLIAEAKSIREHQFECEAKRWAEKHISVPAKLERHIG